MFKKLLISAAIIAATSSTIAMANTAAPYVGVSTGISDSSASDAGFYRGVPATIFAGYGQTINQNVYLGGEVFGTLATMTLSNSSMGNAGLRNTYGYGASFLPGYMLADRTLTFVRLGVIRSRFSSIKSTATGAQFGFGMQTNLMQNWDLRGEYDYATFSSVGGVSPKTDSFNLGLVYKID